MIVRGRVGILSLSAIAGCCLIAVPAVADDCVEGNCSPLAQFQTPTPAAETATDRPLRLDKFRRKPVALGKPTQVVKTNDGRYARVMSGPVKSAQVSHRAAPKSKLAARPPVLFPVVVSPEAATALAMQEKMQEKMQENLTRFAAGVRVVDAEEVNALDLAASDTPLVAVMVPTSSEPPFRTASVQEIIDETHKAAIAATVPASLAATKPLAPAPSVTSSWVSRFTSWLDDGLAPVLAAVRALFG